MLVLDQAGREGAGTSVGGRVLPRLAGFTGHFRRFPLWAFGPPGAALIFINNNRETQGVL